MTESLHKILVKRVGGVSYHSYSEKLDCPPGSKQRREIIFPEWVGKGASVGSRQISLDPFYFLSFWYISNIYHAQTPACFFRLLAYSFLFDLN